MKRLFAIEIQKVLDPHSRDASFQSLASEDRRIVLGSAGRAAGYGIIQSLELKLPGRYVMEAEQLNALVERLEDMKQRNLDLRRFL